MERDRLARYDTDFADAIFRLEDLKEASRLWNQATESLDERVREKLGRYLQDNLPNSIIAEYLGAKSASISFEEIENDLEVVGDIAEKIEALKKSIERRSKNVCVGLNDNGIALRFSLLAAAECLDNVALAIEEADIQLEIAKSFGDEIETRGRGGATRHFRENPEVTLGVKLGSLWEGQGLSLLGGASGDGLDVALRSILTAADPERLARRSDLKRDDPDQWLRRLMTSVRKALGETS